MKDGELTMERELAVALRRSGWLDREFSAVDDGALAVEIAGVLYDLGVKLVRVEVTRG